MIQYQKEHNNIKINKNFKQQINYNQNMNKNVQNM